MNSIFSRTSSNQARRTRHALSWSRSLLVGGLPCDSWLDVSQTKSAKHKKIAVPPPIQCCLLAAFWKSLSEDNLSCFISSVCRWVAWLYPGTWLELIHRLLLTHTLLFIHRQIVEEPTRRLRPALFKFRAPPWELYQWMAASLLCSIVHNFMYCTWQLWIEWVVRCGQIKCQLYVFGGGGGRMSFRP